MEMEGLVSDLPERVHLLDSNGGIGSFDVGFSSFDGSRNEGLEENGRAEISSDLGKGGRFLLSKIRLDNVKMGSNQGGIDGEDKKVGFKRKLKQVKSVMPGDSDDEEPIGSLFKSKKLHNSKRKKLGSEERVLTRAGNPKVVDEDPCDVLEMEDTLASFRKKLKAPKMSKEVSDAGKPSASKGDAENSRSNSGLRLNRSLNGVSRDRSSSRVKKAVPNVATQIEENLGSASGSRSNRLTTGSPKILASATVGKSHPASLEKVTEESPAYGPVGSDWPCGGDLEEPLKTHIKKSGHVSKRKKAEGSSKGFDGMDQPSCGISKGPRSVSVRRPRSVKKPNEEISGFNEKFHQASDEDMDDSLSSLLRKSHSVSIQKKDISGPNGGFSQTVDGLSKDPLSILIRKVRSGSRKWKGETPVLSDGLGQSSDELSKDTFPVLVQKTRSALILKHGGETPKSDGGVNQTSERISKDPLPFPVGRSLKTSIPNLTEESRSNEHLSPEDSLSVLFRKSCAALIQKKLKEMPRSDNGSSCLSDGIQKDLSSTVKKCHSDFIPVQMEEISWPLGGGINGNPEGSLEGSTMKLIDDGFDKHPDGVPDNSVPTQVEIPTADSISDLAKATPGSGDRWIQISVKTPESSTLGLIPESSGPIQKSSSSRDGTSGDLLFWQVLESSDLKQKPSEEIQKLWDCSNQDFNRKLEEIQLLEHGGLNRHCESASKDLLSSLVLTTNDASDQLPDVAHCVSNKQLGFISVQKVVEDSARSDISRGQKSCSGCFLLQEEGAKWSGFDIDQLNGPRGDISKVPTYDQEQTDNTLTSHDLQFPDENLKDLPAQDQKLCSIFGTNPNEEIRRSDDLPLVQKLTSTSKVTVESLVPVDGFDQLSSGILEDFQSVRVETFSASIQNEEIHGYDDDVSYQSSDVVIEDTVLVSIQKSNPVIIAKQKEENPQPVDGFNCQPDSVLTDMPFVVVQKPSVDSSSNHAEELLLAGDVLNTPSSESLTCSPALVKKALPSDANLSKEIVETDDSLDNVMNGSSSALVPDFCVITKPVATDGCPVKPDRKEICPEDVERDPDPYKKGKKVSTTPRAVRKVKKPRHGDMAYEGDVDWDLLMHEKKLLENNVVSDGDRPTRTKAKSDPLPNLLFEVEDGGAAAVAAGLKAREPGPVEKIKFKEILKRRGGLQEYLECRNMILNIWSKDICRILPLSDCGVSDAPSEDEPARASLVREIYAFLDQSGYINVGIASERRWAKPDGMPQLKLSKEIKPKENCGGRVADPEEEVAFIVGQVRSSETATVVQNDDDEKLTSLLDAEAVGSIEPVLSSMVLESSDMLDPEEWEAGPRELDMRPSSVPCMESIELDVLSTDLCDRVEGGGPNSIIAPEQLKAPLNEVETNSECIEMEASRINSPEGNDGTQCNSEAHQRIIVVGAGPAGLSAARHLQRQGFSVCILEARNRIGGRVHTDRSSLSVPVDLGASIITGIEADVATERRPDPSSLICAQLDLELMVLNSDCPLYDVVTGEKVPADLDEALEAEYNSLLDDMVVLIDQKGDGAMSMSLEDGLEYALRRRRMAVSTTATQEVSISDTLTDVVSDSSVVEDGCAREEILSPLERRVMDWHFANLEYGCAAMLNTVSLPHWNQDDIYGGFGGAHCMIKGGYGTVVESLGNGLDVHLNHVVTEITYSTRDSKENGVQRNKVKISVANGCEFLGDAVLITVPLGCLKANTIKFSPVLPDWKQSSIQRLGFGVLNKVILEFPVVFWDDAVDYFGATAEETDLRGQCFMFWNVKKTVGAPVLIALVVGKAAIDGQDLSAADHVNHSLMVLRKLFGEASVPDPLASAVTNWGRDPFSRGAYSYVAIGASGEDYDILGRPVENCLFFAGEATCKEHPDTVGGAMMSGLREAVRIIDILKNGNYYTMEVEAVEAGQRQTDNERNEVREMVKRLAAGELSSVLPKSLLGGGQGLLTKEILLQDMFLSTKTTAGRLHLVKELLQLPVGALKSFMGTKEGLSTLNSWILDSMGKDGTQLLRHCVRLLVLVSTDLLAVRLSGIGRTVKEKVCVHTSRDIRAIASQLVSVWIEVFRKEKAANGGSKFLRQATALEPSKVKPKDLSSGKPPLRATNDASDSRGNFQLHSSAGSYSPSNANNKKAECKPVKLEIGPEAKSEVYSSRSPTMIQSLDSKLEEDIVMSEEEAAAFAAAEAARVAALAAAEAYASREADCSTLRELPKIPSFHKFARREQYALRDDSDPRRRKWSGGVLGRQDCISEIDSRNCRVRNWSVDFSATCGNLEGSRISGDNYTQRSHSNEIACHLNLREHSGESGAIESRSANPWIHSSGSYGGGKDYSAIDRWQLHAEGADIDLFPTTSVHVTDEEDSTKISNENKNIAENQPRGARQIKQAIVDYVASLLMPLYKVRKIDKEGYKLIMKKSMTKVMDLITEEEKAMTVSVFLDFKRKNKIRSFVDKLIERHMEMNPNAKL